MLTLDKLTLLLYSLHILISPNNKENKLYKRQKLELINNKTIRLPGKSTNKNNIIEEIEIENDNENMDKVIGGNTTLEKKLAEAEDNIRQLKVQNKEEIAKLQKEIERKDNEIKLLQESLEVANFKVKSKQNKLAGRFSDLYVDHWTDAYETLEDRYKTDQQKSEILLEILKNVNQFCDTYASKQLNELQGVLGYSNTEGSSDFPESVIRSLKDCMKKASATTVKNMYERYLVHLRRSSSEISQTSLKVTSFVKECLEVCWLMAVEDPPVVFAPIARQGGELNSDFFTFYTKSGNHVEYTVWPALLLHKEGPVLSKGVVQGYRKRQSISENIKHTSRK